MASTYAKNGFSSNRGFGEVRRSSIWPSVLASCSQIMASPSRRIRKIKPARANAESSHNGMASTPFTNFSRCKNMIQAAFSILSDDRS